ncbi:ThuA domain-containing protein [Aestuariimicrobium kwangyangense]|uniref:ThuA domain-containing protein n=1 Tax=Aestuariimicrobium kwangyangense TaxID=396389 RepID=UPI0003B6A5A2|nr:ThuA domain-containing protein [Aestuariimicrobium kwangyangense]
MNTDVLPEFDPTTRRRALIVRGGWDGHHPVAATDLFVPHLEQHNFEVLVHDSTSAYADADLMASVDLVVQCVTMGTIEHDEVMGLRRAVKAGTGLAGWHGGICDSFRNASEYLHLIGAQFASHPASSNPHTIDVLPLDHPITRGVPSFELDTEQYWMLTDTYLDVLATTTQASTDDDPWHRPVTSPAVWTRQWGQGRIFVATPGHDPEVLANEHVNLLVRRGMLWAAR